MSVSYDIIPVGPYEANCVIIFDTDKNAWIVDPGDEAEVINAHLGRKGLVPRRILLTHGHLDHISALGDLLAAWPGLPVMVHAADADWCFTDDRNRLPGYGAPPSRPPPLLSTPKATPSRTATCPPQSSTRRAIRREASASMSRTVRSFPATPSSPAPSGAPTSPVEAQGKWHNPSAASPSWTAASQSYPGMARLPR